MDQQAKRYITSAFSFMRIVLYIVIINSFILYHPLFFGGFFLFVKRKNTNGKIKKKNIERNTTNIVTYLLYARISRSGIDFFKGKCGVTLFFVSKRLPIGFNLMNMCDFFYWFYFRYSIYSSSLIQRKAPDFKWTFLSILNQILKLRNPSDVI